MMKAEEALALANKYTDTHGGGGGGTKDYSQLTNKPSINDVTLSGNKTASDLGLMPAYEVDTTPTESSENLITSGGVWNADKNINNKLQGSKSVSSTSGTIEIPDYGMTESIQMYFKPTQDLHGYDKPWAGGAGKNKLEFPYITTSTTINGVTFTVNDDGTVKANGTATDTVNFILSNKVRLDKFTSGTYIMNGCPAGGAPDGSTYFMGFYAPNKSAYDFGDGTNISLSGDEDSNTNIYIRIANGYTANNLTFYPMIRSSTETDADFEPYSNICPISGQDNATFEWTDDQEIETEVSMNFGNTYYGGFCQFNGQIYPDWGIVDLGDLTWTKGPTSVAGQYRFYASISNNKESSIAAPTSISSHYSLVESYATYTNLQDGYVLGSDNKIYMHLEAYNDYTESDFASAMSGVQLAYELATPSYVRVTPPANLNLTDDYPIEYNGYMASIGYQPKNTVLAEAKKYTNQEIAKLGLPTPPTTDGTYHLECSVSGGIPTIRWVSNS